MIPILGKSVMRKQWLAVLFLLSILSSFVFADSVRAGDTDGIAGYSIRLKNKDFDGSEGGSNNLQSGATFSSQAPSPPVVRELGYDRPFLNLHGILDVELYWIMRLIGR